jgi:hypothetical protein
MHGANIQDLFETYETAKTSKTEKLKRMKRVRCASNARSGRVWSAIWLLKWRLQASKELRAMLNIGGPERESDISRLSDAELIQQLADQAKELGIEIDLNYRFAQKSDEWAVCIAAMWLDCGGISVRMLGRGSLAVIDSALFASAPARFSTQ